MRKEKTPQQIYLEKLVPVETAEMQFARQQSQELGLDGISLSAPEATLVQTLARASLTGAGQKKCVEIGTLTGLSALYWLQMDDVQLWSFEKSPEHHARSQKVLQKYIDQGQCKLVLGDAIEMLPTVNAQGPFDFIFIDGNKAAYLDYWNWAVQNCAVGGVIFVDNVFLSGSVYDPLASQRFSEKQIGVVQLASAEAFANSQFLTTIVPTTEGLLFAKRMNL